MSIETDAKKWKKNVTSIRKIDPDGVFLTPSVFDYFNEVAGIFKKGDFNVENTIKQLKVLRVRSTKLSGKPIAIELNSFINITERYATKSEADFNSFASALGFSRNRCIDNDSSPVVENVVEGSNNENSSQAERSALQGDIINAVIRHQQEMERRRTAEAERARREAEEAERRRREELRRAEAERARREAEEAERRRREELRRAEAERARREAEEAERRRSEEARHRALEEDRLRLAAENAKKRKVRFTAFLLVVFVSIVAYYVATKSPLDGYYQDKFEYSIMKDTRDGQEYRTLKIGDQLWIAQNMSYDVAGSICEECELYGRLYSFEAAENSCPEGYVLPTLRDYEKLITLAQDAKKLQAVKGWSENGVDALGFVALPAGFYSFKDDVVKRRGEMAGFWVNASYGDFAVRLKVDSQKNKLVLGGVNKQYRFSVRCISKQSSVKNTEFDDIVIDSRNEGILRTIKIGEQKWLAENSNIEIGKNYCFDDNNTYCEKYGRLYDWKSAMRVCPEGYRLPSIRDFMSLVNKVNQFVPEFGGRRNTKGTYEQMSLQGNYWMSAEDGKNASYWIFTNDYKMYSDKYSKKGAMSVRCIEDGENTFSRHSEIKDDRDGNSYKTIKIGRYNWMIENLRFDHDNSYCYADDESSCQVFGRLYSYRAALESCPEGWHVADDDEWMDLKAFISENVGDVGSNLKSKQFWQEPGNDIVGMNILPSGRRDFENGYEHLNTAAYLWSGSFAEDDSASYWVATATSRDFVRTIAYKKNYASVRCVEDYDDVE